MLVISAPERSEQFEDGHRTRIVTSPASSFLSSFVSGSVIIFQRSLKQFQLRNGRGISLDPVAIQVGFHRFRHFQYTWPVSDAYKCVTWY